ncbi:MAG: hypothetical protein ACK53T_19765 [Planctomycetota bacterium]|jgi:hypothetical protein
MIRVQSAVRLLMVLVAAMLCTAATVQLATGDATCMLKAEYSGELKTPGWQWNSEMCSGECPSSGACTMKDVSDKQNEIIFQCQCPSGGGITGCRAQSVYKRLSPNDPYVYKGLVCVGEDKCPADKKLCKLQDLGSKGASPGNNFATCQCQ